MAQCARTNFRGGCMDKIKDGKDFWAGLMFMVIGLAFMFFARNYPMGSAVRMGPAYFPTWLGGMMAVLGAIVFFRSLAGEARNSWKVFPFRPYIFIASVIGMSILYFGDEMLECGEVTNVIKK